LVIRYNACFFSGNLFAAKMIAKDSKKVSDYEKIITKGVDFKKCYECHDTIKDLRGMGKHAKLACENCHGNIEAHLKESTNILLYTLNGKHAVNAIRKSLKASNM